ncbi:hypothetical protein MRX96_033782 [Rhipicephalus microplus]
MSYERKPQTRIFVGGLGDNMAKDDLEREFGKYGRLNQVWVAQNPPGFAFLEFDDDRDADEAIRNMNGVVLNGSRTPGRVLPRAGRLPGIPRRTPWRRRRRLPRRTPEAVPRRRRRLPVGPTPRRRRLRWRRCQARPREAAATTRGATTTATVVPATMAARTMAPAPARAATIEALTQSTLGRPGSTRYFYYFALAVPSFLCR